jgi:hypothetical protein
VNNDEIFSKEQLTAIAEAARMAGVDFALISDIIKNIYNHGVSKEIESLSSYLKKLAKETEKLIIEVQEDLYDYGFSTSKKQRSEWRRNDKHQYKKRCGPNDRTSQHRNDQKKNYNRNKF